MIRYSYLWQSEHLEGQEEGRKDRPCAIIAAIRADDAGNTRVLVLPVTHSPPTQSGVAVEIPMSVKRRLGLDETRSWVVLSEWNEFVWPGPDLRAVRGPQGQSIAYGMLQPGLFASIRDQFLSLVELHAAESRASRPTPDIAPERPELNRLHRLTSATDFVRRVTRETPCRPWLRGSRRSGPRTPWGR